MLGAENGMCSCAHLEPLAPLGTFVPIPRVDPPRRSASPGAQRERTHFALLVADGRSPFTSAGRQDCARSFGSFCEWELYPGVLFTLHTQSHCSSR